MGIFSIFATPLGYVMQWIYQLVPHYVLAILIFTLATRLLLFPLSIKNQKSQADRAKLAPRLERIQKKYANDRQKMQEKQQALYQKEGVSMTAGCLPMIVQMLVLMSIIAVIYKPLTYIQRIDAPTLDTCVTAITDTMTQEEQDTMNKKRGGGYREGSYYRELYLMKDIDAHRESILAALQDKQEMSAADAEQVLATMEETRDQFSLFGVSLLDLPNKDGIKPNWLWLIAIASGLAALLQSVISMRYSQAAMSEEQKKAAGCTNGPMMYGMPIFSLIIAFTVPGGVALYWVFSNLLGIVQTVVLNAMYNPAKARAQAEAEYAERRRRKAEDKARLRAARLEEQAAWQREENEKRLAAQGKGKRKKPTDQPAEAPVDEIPDEPVDAEEKKENDDNE